MAKNFPEHWDYSRWRDAVIHASDYRLTTLDVDDAGGRDAFERGESPGFATVERVMHKTYGPRWHAWPRTGQVMRLDGEVVHWPISPYELQRVGSPCCGATVEIPTGRGYGRCPLCEQWFVVTQPLVEQSS